MLLKVNEGFLNADQNVWQAMINRAVSGRDSTSDRLIEEFAESDDFSEVLFEIESLAARPLGRREDALTPWTRVLSG